MIADAAGLATPFQPRRRHGEFRKTLRTPL
jgi:hypothetical protein